MLFLLSSIALFMASVHSISIVNRGLAPPRGQSTWTVSRFNSLVAFGDSYTGREPAQLLCQAQWLCAAGWDLLAREFQHRGRRSDLGGGT
jgi:hypothetical protein